MSTTTTTTDPAAAALELFTQAPTILTGQDVGSDLAAVFQDLAGLMQLEGVLEGMDENDARAAVAVLGMDLMCDEQDKLLSRAAWIRTEEGSAPLHEPERVAVALERVYAIMQQPIAGPMAHRDR
ncbi:MAG TPA: hypothetical protein VFE45_03130 [Coriobacteriia bacterium]|nr:hypothetical protein [Coriobacteriia bacterium]